MLSNMQPERATSDEIAMNATVLSSKLEKKEK